MQSLTSQDNTTARARLFGGNRMKLGVMAFNCSHGSTITTVPEAWKLNWADTIDIAQAVDRPGMDQCCLKVAPPTFRNLILCELSHIGHYANSTPLRAQWLSKLIFATKSTPVYCWLPSGPVTS